MKRVPTQEVKRRSKAASDLFNSYRPYEDRIGQRYRVLVTEESTDKKHLVGHNKFYEQILIPKEQCQMGSSIDVEIIAVGKYHMQGKPISTWLSLPRWASAVLEDRQALGRIWLTTCVVVLCSSLLYKAYRR